MDHPGVDTFYSVLLEIKSKPSVQDVLVEIMEVEDGEYWPFSERVYILSSANPEEIEEWVKILEPDEIEEGYMFGNPLLLQSCTLIIKCLEFGGIDK
ncbi:hypothetical protein [Priestia megaterium]